MFNKTAINAVVMLNLFKAMREAQKNGIAHVRNKKGNAFLAVRKKLRFNGSICFEITNRKGQCAAYILRGWLISRNFDNGTLSDTNSLYQRIAYPHDIRI